MKVKYQDKMIDHEEKVVCHNFEQPAGNENTQQTKVKLISHVTRGWYVILYYFFIFYKFCYYFYSYN